MASRRCSGITRAGKRCRAHPLKDSDKCLSHSDEETQEMVGFGGAQPNAGRPPLPRPHEVMRERIEAELDTILAPYFEAITGAVLTANYEGEVNVSEVPDLEARMRAAERLLDRVYGRPTQRIDHNPDSDSPLVNINLVTDDNLRQAAADLRRRLAAARTVEPGGADAGDRAALDAP